MSARTARTRRNLRAVKPAGKQRAARAAALPRPSEVVELVYQLMMERGGVPHRERPGKDADDHEIRMAEAP